MITLCSVPKGHIAIYVGQNQRKQFLVPISYFNHPLFLDLLNQAEEEFGYDPRQWVVSPFLAELQLRVSSLFETFS
ncbi:hypothetical protein AQUCO_01500371v1 [Aquilegia coerulea]|uniref:Uncharacterized protein n=1 Tax=Aquilegia coerulea TaxID=218851 RepID=A0A2G5DTC4_AQUCA|nr:hypothetical protein AQUCO_01500371v1 [Aquilegia coerulea]